MNSEDPSFPPEGVIMISEDPTILPEGVIRLSEDPTTPPEGPIRLSEDLTSPPEGPMRLSEGPTGYQPSQRPYNLAVRGPYRPIILYMGIYPNSNWKKIYHH